MLLSRSRREGFRDSSSASESPVLELTMRHLVSLQIMQTMVSDKGYYWYTSRA